MAQTVKQWLEAVAKPIGHSSSSYYFNMEGFTIRYSDHHAMNSKYNLSVVKISKDEYVLIGAPIRYMWSCRTPKEVKQFVKNYVFCCKCNNIKNIRDNKKEKKKNVATSYENHLEQARSLVKGMKNFTPRDEQCSLSSIASTCFSIAWWSRISQFYKSNPSWSYALYHIAFAMRLLCDDAKQLIWDAFKQHVENYSQNNN